MEIEAEATAFIVTTRLGLKGSSAAYVSGYLNGGLCLLLYRSTKWRKLPVGSSRWPKDPFEQERNGGPAGTLNEGSPNLVVCTGENPRRDEEPSIEERSEDESHRNTGSSTGM